MPRCASGNERRAPGENIMMLTTLKKAAARAAAALLAAVMLMSPALTVSAAGETKNLPGQEVFNSSIGSDVTIKAVRGMGYMLEDEHDKKA